MQTWCRIITKTFTAWQGPALTAAASAGRWSLTRRRPAATAPCRAPSGTVCGRLSRQMRRERTASRSGAAGVPSWTAGISARSICVWGRRPPAAPAGAIPALSRNTAPSGRSAWRPPARRPAACCWAAGQPLAFPAAETARGRRRRGIPGWSRCWRCGQRHVRYCWPDRSRPSAAAGWGAWLALAAGGPVTCWMRSGWRSCRIPGRRLAALRSRRRAAVGAGLFPGGAAAAGGELEILEPAWRALLAAAAGPELPLRAADEALLERIAAYFLFRYGLKAVNDGDLAGLGGAVCLLADADGGAAGGRLRGPVGGAGAASAGRSSTIRENLEALRAAFWRGATACHRPRFPAELRR